MPVTDRTLSLLQRLRVDVGAPADEAVRQITAAWVAAWDDLGTVWRQLVDELLDELERTGEWPPAWKLARLQSLAAAGTATQQALGVLAAQATAYAAAGAEQAVTATAAAEPALIASQLPAGTAAAAAAVYAANVAPSALEAIAARARQQITVQTWPLADAAVEAIRRTLIAGVATGENPRVAARRMLAEVEGHFNGGLSRAMVIARTEILDAYREASAHVHAQNADVLSGWQWVAALDSRGCPACWGMHGTVHPLEQAGPWGHQQCRCVRCPLVRPWAELGLPGIEPAALTPDAQATFRALPAAEQRQIMGPGRLALLDAGDITWADLATRRDSPGWRPAYVPTPVRLLTPAGRRRRR